MTKIYEVETFDPIQHEIDNEPFDNGEGWLYRNAYHVFLHEFHIDNPYYINAESGYDAIDEAVDIAEARGHVGLFLDRSELTQDPITGGDLYMGERVVIRGNHCLPMVPDGIRAVLIKRHPKIRNGERWI